MNHGKNVANLKAKKNTAKGQSKPLDPDLQQKGHDALMKYFANVQNPRMQECLKAINGASDGQSEMMIGVTPPGTLPHFVSPSRKHLYIPVEAVTAAEEDGGLGLGMLIFGEYQHLHFPGTHAGEREAAKEYQLMLDVLHKNGVTNRTAESYQHKE